MSDPVQVHQRVLFVDDDDNFLQVLRRLITTLSGGLWDCQTAGSAVQALEILRGMKVDLITVDVEMPGVDGVELLGILHQKYPQIPQVAMTGLVTEARREVCLANGAEMCLQKPLSFEEAKALFTMIAELTQLQPTEEFRGVLRKVELMDLVQMKCAAGNSTVLEVAAGDNKGAICIHNGMMIHADCGTLRGEEAFHRLVAFPGSQFRLRPFVMPAERTITRPWESLVMEAVRKRATTGPMRVEAAPGEAFELVSAEPTLNPTGVEATPNPDHWPSFPSSQSSPLRPEEVLLCSAQAEVLYEWQCPNREQRIDFLEFLTRKSWELALGLPLGRIDRVEIHGPRSCLVTQLRADRGLLVRCSQDPANSSPL